MTLPKEKFSRLGGEILQEQVITNKWFIVSNIENWRISGSKFCGFIGLREGGSCSSLSIERGRSVTKFVPIENPDPTIEAPEYWEQVLDSYRLGMGRGIRRQYSFIGTLNNLVGIEEELYRKRTGRSITKGHGPDSDDPTDPNTL